MNAEEKFKLLETYDKAYYNGVEIVSDSVYDSIKKDVLSQLPKGHPYFDKIGHDPMESWPKKKHSIFMGSLNKVSNEDDIQKWVNDTYKKLGRKDFSFVVQYKIDGFSLAYYYKSGILEDVVCRGNGVEGESITKNALMFSNTNSSLKINKNVSIRGEGILSKINFSRIKSSFGEIYKNARNAASGISRRYDGKHSKFLSFIAYDVNATVKRESEKIETLVKLGFVTVPTFVCKNIDDILKIYRETKNTTREKLPYDIDGLVLKIDDVNIQEILGVEHGKPLGQIALKFDPDQTVTSIKNIDMQIGRSGKVTPVAVLQPVELMGSTIKKASLHNFDYIDQNGIGVGAEVSIAKMGDIIPQVVDIIVPGSKYVRPEYCPSCGYKLEWDGVNLWCRSKVCRERDINKIVYWIEVLDMKGFSGKFVEKLWDLGKVKSVSDLYKLKEDDFLAVEGIGEKTVKNFFETLKTTSEMFLERFIVGLGVESCSKTTAGILVENFHTWDKIASIKSEDLQKLPGFAETSSTVICDGLAEVRGMADDLLKVIKIKKKKVGPLTGISMCVTGSLQSMGRKEFYDMVVEKGGIAKNSVAEGLTYLVTNSTDSGSAKNVKAKKLGVKVISEKDFFKLLGDSVPEKKVEPKATTSKIQIESQKLF